MDVRCRPSNPTREGTTTSTQGHHQDELGSLREQVEIEGLKIQLLERQRKRQRLEAEVNAGE